MAITKTVTRFALLLLMGFAAYLACDETLGDPETVICGLVTDSITGLPIDSAMIVLNDTTRPLTATYTDTLGAYITGQFGWGRFVVYCLKEGYQTEWTTIQSSADKSVFDSVNFQLTQ